MAVATSVFNESETVPAAGLPQAGCSSPRIARGLDALPIPDSFGNRVRPAWPRRRQCNDQRVSIPVSGAPFLHNMS